MYLFRVMTEVKHMEGTQLPFDCAGAFVGVYLRAPSIRCAIDEAETQLKDDKYLPVHTYEAVEIDLEDLTDENEEYRSEGDPETVDLIKIYENGGIWYTAFNLYPHESSELQ